MTNLLTNLIPHLPLTSPHAYLDPGSGSYIIQILLATLLGGLFLVKVYWQKIVAFVQGIFSKKQDQDHDETR
jgi:hypothetical protein